MKLATTIGDFKKYTKTSADAVKAYEGTGFKLLDFDYYEMDTADSVLASDGWQTEIYDAGNQAAKLSMSFCQAHSPNFNCLNASGEDYELGVLLTLRSIEGCGMLGVKNLVVHSGYKSGVNEDDCFKLNRDFYNRLLPTAEKCDVNLCIENSAEGNMGSMYFFMEAAQMNGFIDFVGHPKLKACWDTGHANMRHMNQYGAITELGDNLTAVHIQDNFGVHDEHIAPYQGSCDFAPIIKALLDGGFGGFFTFEASNMLKKPASLELKRLAVRLLYETGREMLSGFNCFEE